MVSVEISDEMLKLEVLGSSKVWTMKRKLKIPLTDVVSAKLADPKVVKTWWPGLRVLGTHLPGLIVAGTYKGHRGWDFWDVKRGNRPIEIRAKAGKYRRLVVDVIDTEETIKRINGWLSKAA